MLYLLITLLSLISPFVGNYVNGIVGFLIILAWNIFAGNDRFKNIFILVSAAVYLSFIPFSLMLGNTQRATQFSIFVFYAWVFQIVKIFYKMRSVD